MNIAEIGKFVVERRKSLGVMQAQLAPIAWVSVHTLSKLESGVGNLTLASFLKVMDVLGLQMSLTARQCRLLHSDERDAFTRLLETSAYDAIGAFSVRQRKIGDLDMNVCLSSLAPVSHAGFSPSAWKDLVGRVGRAISPILPFTRAGLRLPRVERKTRRNSISDVQDKVGLALVDGSFAIVECEGDYILKPALLDSSTRFRSDISANEDRIRALSIGMMS